MRDGMPLAGRVAWVTGASRGIGLACARALAAAGAHVALTARNLDACSREAEALRERGYPAEAFALDLAETESIGEVHRQIASRLGPVDVVVNNAGIAHSAPMQDTALDDLRRLLEVNLVGAFAVIQAALPSMRERRFGRIVNIASTAGRTGHRYTTAYTASKHAVVGMTRSLAVEVADRGITANAVCPGWTETDLLATAAQKVAEVTGRSVDEAAQSLARMNPMRRLIQPQEIARAVVFLAEPAAGGITGQILGVDGGEVIA